MRININYYIEKVKLGEFLTKEELLDVFAEVKRLESVIESYVIMEKYKKCQN